MIELAVIGGGPAGLTAALYAARAGRSVAVFEGSGFGGQITLSPLVENYPGLGAVSGMELGDRMYAQAEAAGAELTFSGVQRIERNTDGTFFLETEDGPVSARAVIYAAGAKPRTLGLPGEEELVGRGVSYCALCDGPFFDGQDVAVAGGGNTAFEDALFLAGTLPQRDTDPPEKNLPGGADVGGAGGPTEKSYHPDGYGHHRSPRR